MMAKVVNDTGLVQKPVYPFGVFRRIFFDNGYGISIIKNEASYGHEDGLWEIAVLKGTVDDHQICYDTEITSDVEGWLTNENVQSYIDKVANL